jgi:hypothetical protein
LKILAYVKKILKTKKKLREFTRLFSVPFNNQS